MTDKNMKGVTSIKRIAIPILRRNRVRRAALFGSASRGTMKKDSDVDILVDIKDDISLIGFIGIKLELEKALGKKVDLVEYNTIKPVLRKKILKDQVKIL